MNWLLVAVGAMAGAPLRYLTDRALKARYGSAFPWGTLAVNIAGSLVLGLLAGAVPSQHVQLLLGTGLCGALTTYSTFSWETLDLARRGNGGYAVINAAVSVLAGLGAAFAGWELGSALS